MKVIGMRWNHHRNRFFLFPLHHPIRIIIIIIMAAPRVSPNYPIHCLRQMHPASHHQCAWHPQNRIRLCSVGVRNHQGAIQPSPQHQSRPMEPHITLLVDSHGYRTFLLLNSVCRCPTQSKWFLIVVRLLGWAPKTICLACTSWIYPTRPYLSWMVNR